MFADWVTSGGNLIAMRPDADLATLLGLTPQGGTLAEGYIQVDTNGGPGVGIVGETMQFHGTADSYALDGATAVADLFSTSTAPAGAPAVTMNEVGQGTASAFTYDLARSVVYTRQGNPEWAGQKRDGQAGPIRSDDLFYPDYVDFDKIQIPQADEQQRLLANLVGYVTDDTLPIPRFWYFPNGERAAVVMTGDDHANNGTTPHFDYFDSVSPENCSVEDWECIRGTSYIYPSTPLTNEAAAAYEAQGFEVSVHVDTDCNNWTPASLDELLQHPTRRIRSQVHLGGSTDHASHPLHRVERLGDATQGRARPRHPSRHQLLLLARSMAPGPARDVHRVGDADALRRPGRHHDRRLPGDDPDARRERHDHLDAHQHLARQRHRCAGLLRRLHDEHAHRRLAPCRRPDGGQRRPGTRCAGGERPPDAHLARRPQCLDVRRPRVRRWDADVRHRRRLRRPRPPGHGPRHLRHRPVDDAHAGRQPRLVHPSDRQGRRVRRVRRRRRRLHGHVRRRCGRPHHQRRRGHAFDRRYRHRHLDDRRARDLHGAVRHDRRCSRPDREHGRHDHRPLGHPDGTRRQRARTTSGSVRPMRNPTRRRRLPTTPHPCPSRCRRHRCETPRWPTSTQVPTTAPLSPTLPAAR